MIDSKALIKRAADCADGDQPDEAMALCNQVLLNEPDNPSALFVVGSVLLKAARQVQCIQIAKRLTTICPRDPRGWGLLALCWGELHRYDESISAAEKALACARTDKTLADLAYAHTNAGNWAKAEKYCLEALAEAEVRPTPMAKEAITNVHVSLGYVLLAQGRWQEGFKGFRHTLRTKFRKEWTYGDSVEWNGEPDAVVMVTGEQGLGDEIMAASVVPDAAKACKTFILDCDARLAPLFARSFPNVIVTPTRREKHVVLPVAPTHHKSLFGLGELFRRTDGDFPRQPFLKPDSGLVAMFRALIGDNAIGLAWSGGLPRTGLEPRTAGLNAFLPLIRRGGEFVSLQYKDDSQEVAEFERQYGLKVKRLPWVTQGADIDLLAGLLAACKEVVGVHTSALHLSAAMGVKTTMLTHRGSGWRYAPDELIWYPPATKLHRKRIGETWRESVDRLSRSH